jgi:hypothetical protein
MRQLVEAAGGVEDNGIAPPRHGGCASGRHELPAGRAVDAVADRRGRQRAALVDEVLLALHLVVHVVEEGCHRLADAVAVEAVAAAACGPADERALHLFLQVDDCRVPFAPQDLPEGVGFAPAGRGQRRIAPAPQTQRDDMADPWIQPDQRHEGFLGHPVDGDVRAVRSKIGDDRHGIDDVPQRRRPHQQDAAR